MTPEENDELNPPETHWAVHFPSEENRIVYKKEAFADAFEWIVDDLFKGKKIYATPEKLTDFDRTEHGYKLEKWAIRSQQSEEVLAFVYKTIWRTLMGRG